MKHIHGKSMDQIENIMPAIFAIPLIIIIKIACYRSITMILSCSYRDKGFTISCIIYLMGLEEN